MRLNRYTIFFPPTSEFRNSFDGNHSLASRVSSITALTERGNRRLYKLMHFWRIRMSAACFRSGFIRKVASMVCLLTFPAVAQQSSTVAPPSSAGGADASIALAQQQQNPPAAPLPNAPQPQQLPQPFHVDFSKPVPLFPNPFARYIPRNIAPAITTNSPRIQATIQNGKFMLSLNDALAIALVDNLDIAVARYTLPVADTDILRTKGGQSFQGVPFGLVQNTPGGT